MRFPSAQFLQIGAGKRGAIIDRGDGEMRLPAIVQPIIELPAPMNNFISATGAQDGTYFDQITKLATGVDAGGNNLSNATMNAGIWRISGSVTCQFKGTDNNNSNFTVGLQDPTSAVPAIFRFEGISPISLCVPFNFLFHTINNGWRLFSFTSPTVAGDLLHLSVLALVKRILP
jgi:hypothetical protein